MHFRLSDLGFHRDGALRIRFLCNFLHKSRGTSETRISIWHHPGAQRAFARSSGNAKLPVIMSKICSSNTMSLGKPLLGVWRISVYRKTTV